MFLVYNIEHSPDNLLDLTDGKTYKSFLMKNVNTWQEFCSNFPAQT